MKRLAAIIDRWLMKRRWRAWRQQYTESRNVILVAWPKP